MKEKFTEFLKSKKGSGVLFIIGIVGIVLIYLSTFRSENIATTEKVNHEENFNEQEYTAHLEQQVREIVAAVSGDTAAVVTVTLDSGVTYIYAEDKKENNRTEESEKETETEKNYIIVRDSDGTERPLLVTRKMPTVRGVAIVCGPLGSENAEKIKNAVMAAFDITSRKIYIVNKAY